VCVCGRCTVAGVLLKAAEIKRFISVPFLYCLVAY